MVEQIEWRYIVWPDRAGDLQRKGDKAGLLQELAIDYGKYHHFLSGLLDSYRPRPTPEDFSSPDGYLHAWAVIQEIVRSEAILRDLRHVKDPQFPRWSLSDLKRPLVTRDDQLAAGG